MTRRSIPFFLLALAAASLSVIATSAPSGASSGKRALIGTFKLTPGSCAGETVSGSYFRMIYPGGSVASGKFFDNPDSQCDDKSYTLAVPGTQGGLVTGTYQPNPTPAFNAEGGALADGIVQPQSFTAIDFSIATNKVDPQTGKSVPAPSLTVAKGRISGQLQAWSASWNKLYFNQGSPKPGGADPGLTAPVTGTYNGNTRAFVLSWTSQVVGGPFNGFTGEWHLTGSFQARR
jgi:hypothetical protein